MEYLVWCRSRPAGNEHQSTGLVHLDLRAPSSKNKKPDTQMGIWFFGTAKGTRTPDLLIRSQSLYPTELSPHMRCSSALEYNSTSWEKKQVFF